MTWNPELLTEGARRLVEAAIALQTSAQHPQLGIHHWLAALTERHGEMAKAMAQQPTIDPAALQKYLREELSQGRVGDPLPAEVLTSQAAESAKQRGKAIASERDLASAILRAAGYTLAEPTTYKPPASFPPADSGKAGAWPSRSSDASQPPGSYQPRNASPTPMLEQFGRDVTKLAAEGALSPLIGRQEELALVIETLCRRVKRNPALVGPAGVGKTAIVEGLAQRIIKGDVPESLRGVRIIEIQASSLVAGAHIAGEFEKRIKAIVSEASQPGIILFIDEFHTMIGTGGWAGATDAASILKPALARGELACIAATTDHEYRRFIEPDEALERRFQVIRVQEMTPEQTLQVLASLRELYTKQGRPEIPDTALTWMEEHSRLSPRHSRDGAPGFLLRMS